MKQYCFLLILLAVCTSVGAQYDLPSTEIMTTKVAWDDSLGALSYDTEILHGMAGKYKNQAYFIDKHRAYISLETKEGYTDIAEIDLQSLQHKMISHTEFSEFSPHPYGDNSLTTVTVETKGADTLQRLWKHDLTTGNSSCLLPLIDNIAYYDWISEEEVLLYLLDEVHHLAVANIKTGKVISLLKNCGRTFCRYDSDSFLYVDKQKPGSNYLKHYNLRRQDSEFLIELPKNMEDFTLLSDNIVMTAEADNILYHKIGSNAAWKSIPIELPEGTKITRMTASKYDRLLLILGTDE